MRIITGKHLPRRTFLRGLGAAIALPLLDSMTPALSGAARAGVKPPTRFAVTYAPNGIVMQNWTPKTIGTDFEFTRTLKPMERFRKHTFVLSGLKDHFGNALGDGGGDHARAAASFLTGVHVKKTAGADIFVGVSADQIAAQKTGAETKVASMELSCDESRTIGVCDTGYSCAYTNSISWRGPSTPMAPETNPRLAFERLFGDEDLSIDAETRARRASYNKSILDIAGEQTKELNGKLGTSDRRKLDEYLFAVRDIEKRIERAEKETDQVVPDLDRPAGIPLTFREYMTLMYDLQVVAFQSDVTRVATLLIGREGSVRVYPDIGISDPHHPISHHRNLPENLEKLTKINTFHMELFSNFVGKLQSIQDGDGTLLDHSMLVYGSGIADSNRHTHEDLPMLLVGGGDGTLKPGRHIAYKDMPLTNLYLTLLDKMGVHQETIGDSTGRIEHLTEL